MQVLIIIFYVFFIKNDIVFPTLYTILSAFLVATVLNIAFPPTVKDEIYIEVCNECHPFYTGKQGKSKKAGNIEKFNRKYGITEEASK